MKHLTLLEKSFLLKKTPMFSSLELDLLLPIADKLNQSEIPESEVIFDINEQAYSLYFIVSGEVGIYDSKGNTVISLSEGEVFGEESIFSGSPRSYKVLTQNHLNILTLSKADLLAIIHEYPQVAVGFLEAYARVVPIRPRN